jgi:hypothetical protein
MNVEVKSRMEIYHKYKNLLLWHADQLLGNEREISNYTAAAAK